MEGLNDGRVNNNTRNSSFELLRIISMLLIIAHHYAVHGGFDLDGSITINKCIIIFLSLGGKLGVNLFICITGYFLTESGFKIKKLLKIVLEVLFYSLTILIIYSIFGLGTVSTNILLKSLFPLSFSLYWFSTIYVGLYILSPFINKFISALTFNNYKNLLIILTIMLSVIPTFVNTSPFMSKLTWFVYLYLLSGYIKKYPKLFSPNSRCVLSRKKNSGLIFSASYLLIFLATVMFDKYDVFLNRVTRLTDMNSFLMLICVVSLFMFFKHTHIKTNKYINIIASTAFGIYLIHDNSLLRNFIWEKVFQNPMFFDSKFLFAHSIIVIFIVFVTCMIIDLLRIYLFEKPLFKYINRRKDIKLSNPNN